MSITIPFRGHVFLIGGAKRDGRAGSAGRLHPLRERERERELEGLGGEGTLRNTGVCLRGIDYSKRGGTNYAQTHKKR